MVSFRAKSVLCCMLAVVLLVNVESNSDALIFSDPLLLAYHMSGNMARTIAKRSTDTCDFMSRATEYSTCGVLPLSSGLSMDSLDSFCSNLECKLQCMTNAAGDCYHQDAMFAWEPAPNRVISRAMCENKQLTLSMIRCLVKTSSSCFTDLTNTVMRTLLPLIQRGEYSEYRQRYCRLVQQFLSCLNYRGCSSQEATHGELLWTSGLAYTKCGYSQNNPYFTKYGGPPMCGKMTPNPIVKTNSNWNPYPVQKRPDVQVKYTWYHYKANPHTSFSTDGGIALRQGGLSFLAFVVLSKIMI